jgi:hypothetical protein
MATNYESIVTVHCDTDAGISRDDVLTALEKELGGNYLFRAEEAPGDLTVTAHLVADDSSLAQRQGEHLVSEALSRAGVARGTRVVGAEIRSSS